MEPVTAMEDKLVDSSIEEVCVYRKGALVRRTALFSSPVEHLCIVGLPVGLLDESVRVWVAPQEPSNSKNSMTAANSNAPIAADLKIKLAVEKSNDPASEIRKLQDEAKTLQLKIEDFNERLSHVTNALGKVEAWDLVNHEKCDSQTEAFPRPNSAFLALANLSFEERQKLLAQKRNFEQALLELQERHDFVQTELEKWSHAPDRDPQKLSKTVRVRIARNDSQKYNSETKAGSKEYRLCAEYVVPGAAWSPRYILKVNELEKDQVGSNLSMNSGSGATLEMQALVAQVSGEDWTQVRLRLSTALPMTWTDLPELKTLRIGKRQPEPPSKGWRSPPSGTELLFEDYESFLGSSIPSLSSPASGMARGPMGHAREGAAPGRARSESPKKMSVQKAPLSPPSPPAQMVRAAPKALASEAMPVMSEVAAFGAMDKERSRSSMAKSDSFSDDLDSSYQDEEASPLSDGLLREEPLAAITENLLNYSRLRMAAAGEFGQGKLKPYDFLDETEGSVSDLLSQIISESRSIPDYPTRFYEPQFWDGFDYLYECSSPVDLKSKNSFSLIPVQVQNAQMQLRYVVVPREAKEVYRIGRLVNPLDNPILQGPVDIYLNGEFFVTSEIPSMAPHGETDLGLGVEQAIKLSRNSEFQEESAGALGGKLLLRHKIVIEAINNLNREVDLEIRERVPIKEKDNNDLEIQIRVPEPRWSNYEQDPYDVRGRYYWRQKLSAGAKQKYEFSYDVKISSKHELVGGNRREASL